MAAKYRVRKAARAVVTDDQGLIALMHVTQDGYYKLPGGGLKEGEDRHEALRRECREEIGCDIEILGEVGYIVEYRKSQRLKQISYCYLTKVRGRKGTPGFTDEERERGFELVWLPFRGVKRVMTENSGTDDESGAYIVPRDRAFLHATMNMQ